MPEGAGIAGIVSEIDTLVIVVHGETLVAP